MLPKFKLKTVKIISTEFDVDSMWQEFSDQVCEGMSISELTQTERIFRSGIHSTIARLLYLGTKTNSITQVALKIHELFNEGRRWEKQMRKIAEKQKRDEEVSRETD